MRTIRVIEKTENISWDCIHDLLLRAHTENISKGIKMRTANMTGDELKERIGDGKCFVALDEQGNVVATAAVSIKDCQYWFAKNKKVAYFMLLAILPEYRGAGIMKMLDEKRMEFVVANNLDVILMDTAEGNTKMIDIKLAHGYKKVSLNKSLYSKHYSVILAKWLHECPYSEAYIRCRYIEQYIRVRTRFFVNNIIKTHGRKCNKN